MAALQTLRNKPALLMSVIGGALLLFIVTLTDLNSCSNPNIEAEVNGQELTYQDFEQQVQDEENLQTMLQGSITDDQKDFVLRKPISDMKKRPKSIPNNKKNDDRRQDNDNED